MEDASLVSLTISETSAAPHELDTTWDDFQWHGESPSKSQAAGPTTTATQPQNPTAAHVGSPGTSPSGTAPLVARPTSSRGSARARPSVPGSSGGHRRSDSLHSIGGSSEKSAGDQVTFDARMTRSMIISTAIEPDTSEAAVARSESDIAHSPAAIKARVRRQQPTSSGATSDSDQNTAQNRPRSGSSRSVGLSAPRVNAAGTMPIVRVFENIDALAKGASSFPNSSVIARLSDSTLAEFIVLPPSQQHQHHIGSPLVTPIQKSRRPPHDDGISKEQDGPTPRSSLLATEAPDSTRPNSRHSARPIRRSSVPHRDKEEAGTASIQEIDFSLTFNTPTTQPSETPQSKRKQRRLPQPRTDLRLQDPVWYHMHAHV